MEKYIAFVEQHLKDKQAPYIETIDYYRDKDRMKAVEVAELGLKKCKDDQTDIIIFLIKDAIDSGDEMREAKYMKSAKARRAVDMSRVQAAIDEVDS